MTANRGASIVLPLKVATFPGFHVNTDKPKGEYVIPFKLFWNPGLLKEEQVHYPEGQTMKVGSDELSVFTGTFVVRTDFKVPADAAQGPAILTGRIHYQACNNQMCFRPANLDVRVPIVIQ